MKTKRISRAQVLLADPVIQSYLAQSRKLDKADDVRALTRLYCLLHGRIMQPMRRQICKLTVRRDPRHLARRFLRRIRGGEWYIGGSHIARLENGPGIAWRDFKNDRSEPLQCFLINATLQLPSSDRLRLDTPASCVQQ